jgi:hypothetical protein
MLLGAPFVDVGVNPFVPLIPLVVALNWFVAVPNWLLLLLKSFVPGVVPIAPDAELD